MVFPECIEFPSPLKLVVRLCKLDSSVLTDGVVELNVSFTKTNPQIYKTVYKSSINEEAYYN